MNKNTDEYEKNVNNIINTYNSKHKTFSDQQGELELELRFKIKSFDEWNNLYEKIIENKNLTGEITQSITANIDRQKNVRDRKEVTFLNNIKKSEKYIKKQVIQDVIFKNNMQYKIVLASEKQIPDFNINNSNDIRIRLRSSIVLNEFNDWRFDFTFVKSLKDKSQINSLATYKDKIFNEKNIKLQNFTKSILNIKLNSFSINVDPNVKFEFEVEYIGKLITMESINAVVNYIKSLQNINVGPNNSGPNEYNIMLYEIAKLILIDQDNANSNNKISAMFKNKFVLKHLTNQPINFSFSFYINNIIPKIDDYYLSDKADGDRCYLWIRPNNILLINSTDFINVTDFLNKHKFNQSYFTENTILDCEIMGTNIDKKMFDNAYVFDILYLNGKKVTNENMEYRNNCIDQVIPNLGKKIQKKILVRLSSDPKSENYYKTQIKKVYKRSTRLYPIDGLIFTPNFYEEHNTKYTVHENYFDMIVYKWKPPEQMTIDFLVVKAPKKIIGIEPYIPIKDHDIYLLFCGIRSEMANTLNIKKIKDYDLIFENKTFNEKYFPIQFSPSINPLAYIYYHPNNFKLNNTLITDQDLDYHVVEFKYDCQGEVLSQQSLSKCYWIIERLRTDRDLMLKNNTGFGNDFKTAESTYNSYKNPFDLNMLINPEKYTEKVGSNESESQEHESQESESQEHESQDNKKLIKNNNYFKVNKLPIYKPLTKFNAFVKAQLIRQLEHKDWICDLACGKGQDLFVYNGFEIKNGIFIDVDKQAIEELNKRKYELDKPQFYVFNNRPTSNITVYSKILDLTNNYETLHTELFKNIPAPPNGVDGVVMNFAIHYIISNQEKLNNLINFVDSMLKPGGIFIFTCFDGAEIFKLLKNVKHNETWDLYTSETSGSNKTEKQYSIKKLYNDTEFKEFNQKISVIHPFSNGEYYEENLVNIKHVIDSFKEKGFVIRQKGKFNEWIQKYKRFNNNMYNNMSENDLQYCSLYSYISLWKSV